MASATLEIRDEATGQIIEAVDLAIAKCDDFRPVWKRFRAPWYASRKQQRRSQGRSTGAPWKTYQQTDERDVYQYVKASIAGKALNVPKKVYRTDRFRANLKPLTWPGGKERLLPSLERRGHPDAIWRERKFGLTIGTRVPYARNHDLGIGKAPIWAGGHKIPRRPLLRFGNYALRALADAVGDHAADIATTVGSTRVGYSSDQVRAMQGIA